MSDLVRYPSPLPAPLSKAVRAGPFLFLSGQTPKNPDLTPLRGDIKAQTANTLDAIKATLNEFGLDLGAVIRCTVWLSDIGLIKDFNEIYMDYFRDSLPVRSTVEAKLVNGVDVEIEVTAIMP
ncbi:RidA family protein [Methylobacterium sp. E-045]|uniref:RidA family protein n=1 Tax=Methylobacterium sp. E-045 TaxID=2836575 RepID=UPI001FBA0F94|nr:RidA family protein [Methylobacterium sp. E-045]MCJ2130798.1 RidA family protein [Methylobacterium sp. E-045]